MALEHEDLTEQIIGAAIQVHRTLGPGFLESIYENSLVIELKKRGLQVQKQPEVSLFYEGFEVGQHRLDLLVDSNNRRRTQGHQGPGRYALCHRQVVSAIRAT